MLLQIKQSTSYFLATNSKRLQLNVSVVVAPRLQHKKIFDDYVHVRGELLCDCSHILQEMNNVPLALIRSIEIRDGATRYGEETSHCTYHSLLDKGKAGEFGRYRQRRKWRLREREFCKTARSEP